MLTVIIAESNIESEFVRYKHFFLPFFAECGGNVCCCQWRKGEEEIDHALPDLYNVIRDHPEWRAIILSHSSPKDKLHDHDNPFDFSCNHVEESKEADLFLNPNDASLVKLTHMLAGFPSLGVKRYDTGFVYYNKNTKRYETCTDDSGKPILQSDYKDYFNELYNSDEYRNKFINECLREEKNPKDEDFKKRCREEANKKFRELIIKQKFGSDIKIKLVEVPYDEGEKRKHKILTEKYAFKENRPVEILLLSIRQKQYTTDDRDKTRNEIRRSWEFHDDAENSDFWKIYPNTCRFLCYDIVDKDHTLHSCESWRFFLLTLTLAINKIPGQVLQAYSLYNVDLQIDTEELRNIYNVYLEKLLSFKEILQERMSRAPELTQEKKKELVPVQYIPVEFGQVEESKLIAASKNIGLAADCPVDEALFWQQHMQGARHIVENILFAPQEIVAEKAFDTRNKIDGFSGFEQVLDCFQRERIYRRIDDLEPCVINTNLYGMLDTKRYIEEVAKAGETVQKYIRLRLTRRKILFISFSSLLIYLCGYLPYLINSAKISWQVLGWAFVLAITALVILAGGASLSILFLRDRLVKKIKNYNKDVFDIFNSVKHSAHVFSSYFSNVCTYMYARSLLSGEIQKKKKDLSIAEIYKEHLKCIEDEFREYTKLCKMYDVPLNICEGDSVFIDIDDEMLEKSPSQSHFYELDKFMEGNTVKLTSSKITKQARKYLTSKKNDQWDLYDTGITLNAPYGFISGLNLVREEIYKKEVE